MRRGLVFHLIVKGLEVEVERLLSDNSFQANEDHPNSRTPRIGSINVKSPGLTLLEKVS